MPNEQADTQRSPVFPTQEGAPMKATDTKNAIQKKTPRAKKTGALVCARRASREVEDDLLWFFNQAECDLGLSSNYYESLGYFGELAAAPPDTVVEEAHRYRRIRGRLKAISDSDAGVLQAAYTNRPWPAPLARELGRLTGVAVRLCFTPFTWPVGEALQDRAERVEAERLSIVLGVAGAELLGQLRREAEARFVRALRAYAGVRR
jgi:hypothetical protein